MRVKVAIIGASGYTGGELLRLLARHPRVEVVCATSRTYAGQRVEMLFPNLQGTQIGELAFVGLDTAAAAAGCEVTFTAVPHGVASVLAPSLLEQGQKVIDLGADFRLRSVAVYSQWYKVEHASPGLLAEAVYGLPELHRREIRSARLVGNPGCYPTSVILGLAPLLREGLVDLDSIVINSASGVSGAGRSPALAYHYPERTENYKAYGIAGHRHIPEIEQELSLLAGQEVRVSFTPHLAPMTRGILSTINVRARGRLPETRSLLALYREFYRGEAFVRVLPEDFLPETKAVAGTNFCDLAVRADPRLGRIIVLSAIDNLGKGAAGQALQNFNLLQGWEEGLGLSGLGIYP